MKTASEIIVQLLTARCPEIENGLRAAEKRSFRLFSVVGEGDITEAYREGLRSELAACLDELAAWQP